VGCIDFYKQMYTNNKKLVKKGDIKNLIEKIIKYANNLSIKKYQKSKLMDFLRIAVIFDDEGYDINQNMVMELISEYQVSSKNKIVFLKAEEGISSSLSSTINESYELWISEYMRDYDIITLTYEPLDVSPQLCYVATFFEVFSALIENENVVNIGKASNMHPIDFLLNVLKQSGRCWIVVRHLRAYLNRLYYF
jgi:inositol 1,4,5-triphosphate receptor type 1/inositol 1,4,5-triphosphate receptor type 3